MTGPFRPWEEFLESELFGELIAIAFAVFVIYVFWLCGLIR